MSSPPAIGACLLGMAVALAGTGCRNAGSTLAFHAPDNQVAALERALATQPPPRRGPVNESGAPLLVAVGPGVMSAFDLARSAVRWRVTAQVRTRVQLGRRFAVAATGARRPERLVSWAIVSGRELWSEEIEGELLGLSSDDTRVFLLRRSGAGFELTARDGASGDLLWRLESSRPIGVPAARGGLVLLPFFRQWLVLLSAQTGAELARVRGLDEEIGFAIASGEGDFFGSQRGLFRLDRRAATGRRAGATYRTVTLPEELGRAALQADAFDPLHGQYSARDRTRILWRASAATGLEFVSGLLVVHMHRYLFALAASGGGLRWVYRQPREEIAASAHAGGCIALVSVAGEVVGVDVATGAPRYRARLPHPVRGASFDADGWQPTGAAAAAAPAAASDVVRELESLVEDPDRRFDGMKRFALRALAALPEAAGVPALLRVVVRPDLPEPLAEQARVALGEVREPAALPLLQAALRTYRRAPAGTPPHGVGAIASGVRAVLAAAIEPVAGAARAELAALLVPHLVAPHTPVAELPALVGALGAIGTPEGLDAVADFLLAHRADPGLVAEQAALGAAAQALIVAGPAHRQLVAWLAQDGRTTPTLATRSRQALAHFYEQASARGTAAPAGPHPDR